MMLASARLASRSTAARPESRPSPRTPCARSSGGGSPPPRNPPPPRRSPRCSPPHRHSARTRRARPTRARTSCRDSTAGRAIRMVPARSGRGAPHTQTREPPHNTLQKESSSPGTNLAADPMTVPSVRSRSFPPDDARLQRRRENTEFNHKFHQHTAAGARRAGSGRGRAGSGRPAPGEGSDELAAAHQLGRAQLVELRVAVAHLGGGIAAWAKQQGRGKRTVDPHEQRRRRGRQVL